MFNALTEKSKTMDVYSRHGGLVIDEIKLSEHLNVKSAGHVEGFVDLGDHTPADQKIVLADQGMVVLFQPLTDGMVVCIDGVEQTITPLIAEDGCRVRNGNGFAYRAQDGTLLTIFVDPTPDTSVPVPSTPPAADTVEPILSQSPGCFASDETQAVGTAAQPLAQSPEEEESRENDLWSGAKTRFFITKYMELKELLRKKGGFRQVSFIF
ncbi:hypothetical protein HPB49_004425 [Dermacentor silvarum]|uniref:Uncharacterized protein n=1 Tax=Dermacentor silvarum TaxID=543639 RepID=A0ACB8DVE9_DERSI|nr:hypothetical protein HPB49_004425 [Dermacentor silvarum]